MDRYPRPLVPQAITKTEDGIMTRVARIWNYDDVTWVTVGIKNTVPGIWIYYSIDIGVESAPYWVTSKTAISPAVYQNDTPDLLSCKRVMDAIEKITGTKIEHKIRAIKSFRLGKDLDWQVTLEQIRKEEEDRKQREALRAQDYIHFLSQGYSNEEAVALSEAVQEKRRTF